MDTNVLHAMAQRFPTPVLKLQLESELERMLREQVLERERGTRVRMEGSKQGTASADGSSNTSTLAVAAPSRQSMRADAVQQPRPRNVWHLAVALLLVENYHEWLLGVFATGN